MKKTVMFLLACTLVFAVACKKDKKDAETEVETTVETEKSSDSGTSKKTNANKTKEVRKASAILDAKSNSGATGNVAFKEEGGIVTMIAVLTGLSEGAHAVHLHEKADCSADDGTSSGGHWNPTGQPHGKWGAKEGYHKGDIGNFTANADGNITLNFQTNEWCIGCGDPAKDILGKAVIVHQGEDDFKTQPTGAAGGRVSCGGIIEQ